MNDNREILQTGLNELKKRRREIAVALGLGVVFLILTFVQFKLFDVSRTLPFVHSVFFFGLVNFNIILLVFLLFLIFRNVVKAFAETQGRFIGVSLKGKLIAAFVAFSFVPTLLMFLISVFYINSSFDKWFSIKMAGVLKSSLEVTNAYYVSAKKKNYHFAHQISDSVGHVSGKNQIRKKIAELRKSYSLDSIEYYPSMFKGRILALSDDERIPVVPDAALEFLQKGLVQREEASTIHHFGDGNLVRVIVPVSGPINHGAVIVSSFVPLSLITKMNDIAEAYDDFKDINPLEYPLKSIYLVILILMTLVILLGATWFGFHLAKQLSIPLVHLGKAARRVSGGDYRPVEIRAGSEEINQLVDSFNQMTRDLQKSEREVLSANENLKLTLGSLDKHSRYIEVVLANVSTGVISIDQNDRITTINQHAGKLLKLDAEKYVGRHIKTLIRGEYHRTFNDLLINMKEHGVTTLHREIRVNIKDETLPLQIALSILRDENNQELGKILVFDDLTVLVNAQRAAAWRDVARRIAHEIKNPLTPIKLSAQRLQKRFGSQVKDEAFDSSIKMIIEQVEDMRNLVNEFSNFARMPQARPILSSLNAVVDESLVLYRTGHKSLKFNFSPDHNLPDFKFDPKQIKRVVENLVDNAVAALKDQNHGKVEISTYYDSLLKIVRLTVADNGPGIPNEYRTQVFEPYFSTKEGGTGLGLAIVKRIIEDHSGFIRAFANHPDGTKIVVELPVVEVSEWRSLMTQPQIEISGGEELDINSESEET